ncbi:MAG: tetratricopeptide repeat protein [Candidatus Lindowbacteria bacterium]|nr:tetratricopeptide repeat protein [Candidatus Lindowbacteria bacterium]
MKKMGSIALLCLVSVMAAGCARFPYRVGLAEGHAAQPESEFITAAVYNKMGVNYESAGQYENAVQAYRKCLASEPKNDLARTNLGNALAKLCRFKEAERCYRDVLSRDPQNLAALNNLAWLLVSIGEAQACEEGVEIATRCLTLAAGVEPAVLPSLLDTLAWGNHRLQREHEALRHIQEAADLLGAELNNNPLIWGHYRIIAKNQAKVSQQSEAP